MIHKKDFKYLSKRSFTNNKRTILKLQFRSMYTLKLIRTAIQLDFKLGPYECKRVDDLEEVVAISQDTEWVTKKPEKAQQFMNEGGAMILIFNRGEKHAGTFERWTTFYHVNGGILNEGEVKRIKEDCKI
jgi:hypothetical protein